MYQESLLKLLIRDLNRLSEEITKTSPEFLYKKTDNIKNSIGNLALHLCGNLSHFIAHVLGKDSYIRKRDDEFNTNSLSKNDIINEVSHTITRLEETAGSVNSIDLSKDFPIKVFSENMSTEAFLIHLYGHLNYHLGQINYLRRFNSEFFNS